MYATRTTAILACFVCMWFVSATAPVWSQGMEDTYDTLIRGLEQRQKLVTSISGVAVEETVRSEAYWQMRQRVTEGIIQKVREHHQAATGQALQVTEREVPPWDERYARGSFLVRFDLGELDWEFEAQALIWPGDYTSWVAVRDLTRLPTEAHPFYRHTVCREGIDYTLYRGAEMPQGNVYPVQSDRPGPLQTPFCTWFSTSLGRYGWAERLRDERYQLISIQEEMLGEWACQHVVRVLDDEDSFSESHLWIAPDADFAVVRFESLWIEKRNPEKGIRNVYQWGDFEEVNDAAFLPTEFRRDEYRYGEGADTPWLYSTRVNVQEVRCARNPFPTPFPVGTLVDAAKNIGPDADFDHISMHSEPYSAWRHATQVFIEETLPPDDPEFVEANPEYLRELDGTELAEMMARAGIR